MLEYPCAVDRWKGKIEFNSDYLPFPHLVEWERALDKAKNLKKEDGKFAFYATLLPVAIPFVDTWEISGLPNPVTYKTFPASPRLTAWLVDCITDLYQKTNAPDPNSQGG